MIPLANILSKTHDVEGTGRNFVVKSNETPQELVNGLVSELREREGITRVYDELVNGAKIPRLVFWYKDSFGRHKRVEVGVKKKWFGRGYGLSY